MFIYSWDHIANRITQTLKIVTSKKNFVREPLGILSIKKHSRAPQNSESRSHW